MSIVSPYRWECHTCSVVRHYNSRRLACEKAALKHHREHRDHEVVVLRLDGTIIWESRPKLFKQLELDMGCEKPPF